MRVIFLGTGTSQGVPIINCDCPVCVSDNPKNKRFRTHIHVEIAGYNIQVDAAQEFRIQAIKHRIPKIDIALLTHGHA
ncbi:MAG: MBL fold metallo-hydrolase, partial [Verrucomicrobiota bacterium]